MPQVSGRFTLYSDQYGDWSGESNLDTGGAATGDVESHGSWTTGDLDLRTPDFLGQIPDGSTLDAITIDFEYRRGTTGGIVPRMYWGWAENNTERQVGSDLSPPTSYQAESYDGSVLVGTPEQLMIDLKDGSLEARFWATASYGTYIYDVYVNDVLVTVTYTPPFKRDGVTSVADVDGVDVGSISSIDGA